MMRGRNTNSSSVIPHIPKDSVGVEIGVWKGDTSRLFLDSGRVRHLHLVDPWSVDAYDSWDGHLERYADIVGGDTIADVQRYYDKVYHDVVQRFAVAPVSIHRMTSARFFELFPYSCHWVYIDGNHDEERVRLDLIGALTAVHPGGIIFGDDYGNPSTPGVKVAVDGRKRTCVPCPPSASPTASSGLAATPSWKRMKCFLPPRQMVRSSSDDRALTTETPTPCRPPETL